VGKQDVRRLLPHVASVEPEVVAYCTDFALDVDEEYKQGGLACRRDEVLINPALCSGLNFRSETGCMNRRSS
jgi:hypothetical protein